MEMRKGSLSRFFGLGFLVLFLCWQHVQATRLGYHLESTRKLIQNKRGHIAALKVECDQLISPIKISERASNLGLVPASPESMRYLQTKDQSTSRNTIFLLLSKRLVPLVSAIRS